MTEAGAAPARRLHVLAVAGVYPKLSETFVQRQIAALCAAGHRVTVIAGAPSAESPAPASRPPGIRLLQIPSPPSGTLRRRTRAVGASLHSLSRHPLATSRILSTESSYHERWLTTETLLLVSRLEDVDVVHSHFGPFGDRMVRVFDALNLSVPVVTAFHGLDVTVPLKTHGSGVYDQLFESGARFLPISEHWRKRLIELGAPPERTQVHRMGVPVDQMQVPVRVEGPELRVLSIGRLVEKKGFDDGLRAIWEARAQGTAIRWTLVGDGPLHDHLAQLAMKLGINSHVTFRGALAHREALELLATHDVLLCPSRTAANGDMEGIPVVLMEALASGMPAVATRHSGIPELVEDGRCGLLADEGDAHGLAQHLVRLAADPELRQRLGTAGRRRVEQDFDSRELDHRLEKILTDVAHDATGKPGARAPRRGPARFRLRNSYHPTAERSVIDSQTRGELQAFRRLYRLELSSTGTGWRARAGRAKRRLRWPLRTLRLARVMLRRCGARVAVETGVSKGRQLREMCLLGLRYRFPPEVYYRYRLYLPERAAEAVTYLHWDEHNRVLDRLVRQRYPVAGELLEDKRSFSSWCEERGIPSVPILATFEGGSCQPPRPALPRKGLFSKPADGRGGELGLAWEHAATDRYVTRSGTTMTADELVEHFKNASRSRPYLLQPRVEPIAALEDLTGGGLATVRVVTGRPPTGAAPEVLAATLGMPVGNSSVDNFHAGGICSKVDLETGRLGPGVRVDPEECLIEYRTHPDTGAPIVGAPIPDWVEVVDLALRAHAQADGIAFVGWDIAPTAAGPLILEANLRWDAAMPQAPEGDPLGRSPYVRWLLEYIG